MDSYDEIPYDSTPVTETQPERLAVLGRLFGLESAAPERCRVLELGCAAGGNLIPAAWYLPQARFVGIELSARQAAEGQALIARLGLANAEIRQGDILALGEELGEFDYILAHGVYSWVPEPVRERILALCGRHLARHGIAYVSYNTLPGWRMRGMLRDILLYASRGIAAPGERLAAARRALAELDGLLTGLDALSAVYLRGQIDYLKGAHPSYLYHEYLAEVNEPCLFSDFVARAEAHGLQYLCDGELHTMFASTLGGRQAELLERIEEGTAHEQYIDFVRNRNFRQSLLVRADCTLTGTVDLERFAAMALFGDLLPPPKPDLKRVKPQPYRRRGGDELEVSHPLTKAALAILAERYPDSLPAAELAAEAAARVAAAGGAARAGESEHLLGELFSLYAHLAVGADLRPQVWRRPAGVRPRLTALARLQAEAGLGHLATPRHTTLAVDPFATRLATLLDGSAGREALAERLTAELAAGRLQVEGLDPAAGAGRLRPLVEKNLGRLLELFERQGVLEP